MPSIQSEILSSVFVGHSFHGPKKSLWLAKHGVYLGLFGDDRNGPIFRDTSSTLEGFLDLIVFIAL